MEDQTHPDEQIEKIQAVKFESSIQELVVFEPEYSAIENDISERRNITRRAPSPPLPPGVTGSTVNQPTPNAFVGLNQPFPEAGTVTDRGGTEPITIEPVTVRIDGGPMVDAPLKNVSDKTLTKVSILASAKITGGSDPHTR